MFDAQMLCDVYDAWMLCGMYDAQMLSDEFFLPGPTEMSQ